MSPIKNFDQQDDMRLFILMQRGDEKAFNAIYHRYAPLLFLHANRMLKDSELTKDVVQDLFASLWHKRNEIIVVSNLKSYLYTSVRNKVLDLFAKEKVRLHYQDSLLTQDHKSNVTEQAIQTKELTEIIEMELKNLPEQMRKVFLLSRQEEKSYKEIADEMDITEGTVKKQIYLALKRLKKNITYIFLFY